MKAYGTMIFTGLLCAFLVSASFLYQKPVENDLTDRITSLPNRLSSGKATFKTEWLDVILNKGGGNENALLAHELPQARILENHEGIIEKAIVHAAPNAGNPSSRKTNSSLQGIAIDYAEDGSGSTVSEQTLKFTRTDGQLECTGIIPAEAMRAAVETTAQAIGGIDQDVIDSLPIAPDENQGWWWESLEDFVPQFFQSVTGNAYIECSLNGLTAKGKLSSNASFEEIDQLLRAAAPATGNININLNAAIPETSPEPNEAASSLDATTSETESQSPPAPSPIQTNTPESPSSSSLQKFSTELVGAPITFGANFSGVEKAEKAKVMQAAQELKALGEGMRAIIKGYSDYGGNSSYRKNLAHQRAENVKDLLAEAGLSRSAFTVVTEETGPGGTDDNQSSRRVEILKIIKNNEEEGGQE